MATFTFREHDVQITGERHHLEELAELLRRADVDGTLGDLVYKIEYAFDIDGIRSEDEENLTEYVVEITEQITHRVIVPALDATDAEGVAEELCSSNDAVLDFSNSHDYHRSCYTIQAATAEDRVRYKAYNL
jgi:hypothetical protein